MELILIDSGVNEVYRWFARTQTSEPATTSMKALAIATERADSKARLQSLLDADFRVRSLTAASCASFVSVIATRRPRKKGAPIGLLMSNVVASRFR